MSNPFKEFVEEMARLAVPEDDTEESRARREAAASESGTPISELDESDIIACADDEFLCSEALALWAMIRKARGAGKTDFDQYLKEEGKLLWRLKNAFDESLLGAGAGAMCFHSVPPARREARPRRHPTVRRPQ